MHRVRAMLKYNLTWADHEIFSRYCSRGAVISAMVYCFISF